MRKLILEEWVSLDGFAEDMHGSLDFFPSAQNDMYSDKEQLAFLETIDTVLLGRKTYELFARFWPTATTREEIIADRLNELPKLVFSNTLDAAPWGEWAPAQVVSGEAITHLAQLKREVGKDMILWGSLSLAQSLIKADLIDEFRLRICPTLVGGGRRLFPELQTYSRLQRMSIRTYDTGVVSLIYQPVR